MILINRNNCIITRLFTFTIDLSFSLLPFFFLSMYGIFSMGPDVLQNTKINIRLTLFWIQWLSLKSLVTWRSPMQHSCYNHLLDANAMKHATRLSSSPQMCPGFWCPSYWQVGRTLLKVRNPPCHSTGPTIIYQLNSFLPWSVLFPTNLNIVTTWVLC